MSPITYIRCVISRIASRARTSRLVRRRAIASTSKVCSQRRSCGNRRSAHSSARHVRGHVDVGDLTSSGEGSSRSKSAPERQHALPGAGADCPFGRACPSCRHSIVVAIPSGGGERANLAHFDRIEGSAPLGQGPVRPFGISCAHSAHGFTCQLGINGRQDELRMRPGQFANPHSRQCRVALQRVVKGI